MPGFCRDDHICKGIGAFACVLNSNIRSDDVQWYRFIKDTSTTAMVDPNGEIHINFLNHTIEGTMNGSLYVTTPLDSFI